MRALSFSGLIALAFGHYLTTALPAYLLLTLALLTRLDVKLPSRIALYVCATLLYWVAVLAYGFSANVFSHMFFYSGFLLAYAVVVSNGWEREFLKEKFVVMLCLMTILEAVLFNSPIGQSLYFFPPEGEVDRTAIFGFYQRPMGIAGNPSMTAGTLFFLIALVEKNRGPLQFFTQTLVVLTTVVLASGTAFGLLLLYLLVLLFRSRKLTLRNVLLFMVYLLVVVIALAMAFGLVADFGDFRRFSADYVVLLYEYKLYSLNLLLNSMNIHTAIFGSQIKHELVGTSGDAGYIVAVDAIGFLGAGLLFMAPLLYPAEIRRNLVPTTVFYATFIHYPGLLSPPGQVLFACYLCLLSKQQRQESMRADTQARLLLTGAMESQR